MSLSNTIWFIKRNVSFNYITNIHAYIHWWSYIQLLNFLLFFLLNSGSFLQSGQYQYLVLGWQTNFRLAYLSLLVLTTQARCCGFKSANLRMTYWHNEANGRWYRTRTRSSLEVWGCNSTSSHTKPQRWLGLRLGVQFHGFGFLLWYTNITCFTNFQQFTVIHE